MEPRVWRASSLAMLAAFSPLLISSALGAGPLYQHALLGGWPLDPPHLSGFAEELRGHVQIGGWGPPGAGSWGRGWGQVRSQLVDGSHRVRGEGSPAEWGGGSGRGRAGEGRGAGRGGGAERRGGGWASAGVGRPKLQAVAHHEVVVPHVELVVTRVVVHGGHELVGVGEGQADGLLAVGVGVEGVVHAVAGRLAVIVHVNGAQHVEHAAHHEGVGGRALVVAGLPRALEAQRVGVELAHHQPSAVALGGVDYPQPVLVHGQVNVGLAAPAVGRRVVVVGRVDHRLPALDARAQVVLDDVARALLVVEDGAVVDHKARAVHAVGQAVGGGVARGHVVLPRGVLGERVGAVGDPGHDIDAVARLQRVLAPRARLVL